jgi:hypothetical protein
MHINKNTKTYALNGVCVFIILLQGLLFSSCATPPQKTNIVNETPSTRFLCNTCTGIIFMEVPNKTTIYQMEKTNNSPLGTSSISATGFLQVAALGLSLSGPNDKIVLISNEGAYLFLSFAENSECLLPSEKSKSGGKQIVLEFGENNRYLIKGNIDDTVRINDLSQPPKEAAKGIILTYIEKLK